MRNWAAKLTFWLAYFQRRTPWDTNVTPPELVKIVKGAHALPRGRALDLGCGTGTNVIYLAQHGWEAVGVDFVEKAIREARDKAKSAGVQARFFTGDVTRLDSIRGLEGSFNLVLDIGCFHSLTPEGRRHYAAGLVDRLLPDATYLLYAWAPHVMQGRERGVGPQQVEALFAPQLRPVEIQQGEERGRASVWYRFERLPLQI